jgi:hypothetical protein
MCASKLILMATALAWASMCAAQAVNHPPTVKIQSPKANDTYAENAQVRYEIDVSDAEDGDSKFQEINPT